MSTLGATETRPEQPALRVEATRQSLPLRTVPKARIPQYPPMPPVGDRDVRGDWSLSIICGDRRASCLQRRSHETPRAEIAVDKVRIRCHRVGVPNDDSAQQPYRKSDSGWSGSNWQPALRVDASWGLSKLRCSPATYL